MRIEQKYGKHNSYDWLGLGRGQLSILGDALAERKHKNPAEERLLFFIYDYLEQLKKGDRAREIASDSKRQIRVQVNTTPHNW